MIGDVTIDTDVTTATATWFADPAEEAGYRRRGAGTWTALTVDALGDDEYQAEITGLDENTEYELRIGEEVHSFETLQRPLTELERAVKIAHAQDSRGFSEALTAAIKADDVLGADAALADRAAHFILRLNIEAYDSDDFARQLSDQAKNYLTLEQRQALGQVARSVADAGLRGKFYRNIARSIGALYRAGVLTSEEETFYKARAEEFDLKL